MFSSLAASPRRVPILYVVIMVRPMACLLFKKGPCRVASAGVKPWVQMSLRPQLLTLGASGCATLP